MTTLTTTEAIAILGYKSAAYLNQLLQSGQIEGTQDSGGRWQVSEASVLAFKANRKDKPKIIGAGFVESVSKGEFKANQARLNEKLMGANPTRAVYCLSSGEEVSYIQWLVRGDEARKVFE